MGPSLVLGTLAVLVAAPADEVVDVDVDVEEVEELFFVVELESVEVLDEVEFVVLVDRVVMRERVDEDVAVEEAGVEVRLPVPT